MGVAATNKINPEDFILSVLSPEARANLWKGAPQAHNRTYPLEFTLTDKKTFVNKGIGWEK